MSSKKVAVYARVSTDGQAEDGYSIAAQLEATKGIAKYSGYTVVEEYVDRGISGKSMENRPAFMKMLADAKEGRFEEVIVWKLNRLSRNHLDLLKLYDELELCNVSFKSVSEPFDTGNPAGKLLFNMLASIGEFERETIVENVKSGMKQKAREGGFNGGKLLGYRSFHVDGSDKKKVTVVEKEADIIRLIFALYVKGKGYKKIAIQLNDLNHMTVRSNLFSIQSVRNIIMNPTYTGLIRFNKYVNCSKNKRKGNESDCVLAEGQHEAIIDRDTWEMAEAIRKSKTRNNKKVRKGVSLLTGLLKCPTCGSPMVAGRTTWKNKDGTKKKYRYYQCSKYRNYGSAACKSNSINADYAEKYVLSRLETLSFDKKLIKDVIGGVNDYVSSTVRPVIQRIEQLELEIDSSEQKKERVFKLYEDGVINQEILRSRLENHETDVSEAMRQKESLSRQIESCKTVQEIPIDRIQVLLGNLGKILEISSREQIKSILHMVIDKISVNDKREIQKIHLRFDESSQKIFSEESSDEDSSIFMPFCIAV